MRKTTLLLATTALISAFAALPAAAQDNRSSQSDRADAPEEGVGDILVTAQRRSESAQDVPIAISAFTGDQLREQGVSSTLDLGQLVPNLIAQSNTGLGSANAFYLRGLGNTEAIPTFDPPVGTYVDDIYLSRQNANNLNLFDVDRVEVLRGPQGTLFGRNTTGGAINVILRQPEFNRVSGYAEIGYGSYNRKLARGSIDLPVAPTFAIKLSGYWQDDDGYAINTTTGQRTNDDDGFGIRIGFRGELGNVARWSGSYAYIEANGENLLNFDCDPRNVARCNGRFVTTGLPVGRRLATSPYLPVVVSGRKANYGLGNYTQTHLVTSNLEFDVGTDTTIALITGYVAQAQQYALDFSDGRALPSLTVPIPPVQGYVRGGFDILNDGHSEQFSQEVKVNGRIGSLVNYVAGVFYLTERNTTDFADLFTISPTTTLLLADRTLRNTTSALAGYVQADFNVTPELTLTAGIRYTNEIKRMSVIDNRASCNDGSLEATCLTNPNLIAPSGLVIPLRQRASVWTPRFAINYRPNDDLLLFASATRGFKSGGWNARGTAANTFLPFGPETVWSYEAGIKSDLFDRRVRANLTVYWQETSDLQSPSALVNPVTGAITFLTRNFADYRNKGVELELQWVPVDGLRLYFNGGYQDDQYRLRAGAPATDIYGIQSVQAQQAACLAAIAAGRIPGGPNTPACAAGIVTATGALASPVRTPDFTIAMGGSYRFEFGNGMSLVPSVNASWHSDQEVQTSNYTIYGGTSTGTNGTFPANPFGGPILQGSRSPAAWLVSAGIALNGTDNAWQLSLNCTNCFDEEFTQSALANTTYINQPRTWTIRAKYNF